MKKLSVVGIGPGNYEGLTVGAVKALEEAELIVGYTVYCKLICSGCWGDLPARALTLWPEILGNLIPDSQ